MEDELAISVPYSDRATELGYSLLNSPAIYTSFSLSLVGRPGVIHMAFTCPLLAPYLSEWSDTLPSTGLDHPPSYFISKPPFFVLLLPHKIGP